MRKLITRFIWCVIGGLIALCDWLDPPDYCDTFPAATDVKVEQL